MFAFLESYKDVIFIWENVIFEFLQTFMSNDMKIYNACDHTFTQEDRQFKT